jgi:uncharacterized protein YndB with AHSA1/START domain
VKFKLELLINKPRIEVWKFFTDAQKTKLWQRSLQRINIVSGITGQPGTISTWMFKQKEREFSLTDTVLSREDPSQYTSQFENEFATNVVSNTFLEQENDKTLWVMETTYTFKTLVMKVIGPTLKKNYVLRAQREMERLKESVEKE